MRERRLRTMKRAALLAGGVMFINFSDCLPKDYWYHFAGAGRTTILNAFAETVFTTITDALFPGLDDDDDNNNNNGA